MAHKVRIALQVFCLLGAALLSGAAWWGKSWYGDHRVAATGRYCSDHYVIGWEVLSNADDSTVISREWYTQNGRLAVAVSGDDYYRVTYWDQDGEMAGQTDASTGQFWGARRDWSRDLKEVVKPAQPWWDMEVYSKISAPWLVSGEDPYDWLEYRIGEVVGWKCVTEELSWLFVFRV